MENDTESTQIGQAGEDPVVDAAVGESQAPVETAKPIARSKGDASREAFDKAWDEAEAKADAEAGATEKPKDDASAQKASATPTQPADTAAPADWSAAEKSAYGRLPKDAQAQVMRLYKSFQAGYTQKSMKLSEQAKLVDELDQVIAPLHQDLAVAGMTPTQGIAWLTKLHTFAKADPVGYARWFMQQAGIKPEMLSGNTQPGAAQEGYVDPEIAALRQQLQGVQGMLAQQERQKQIARSTAVQNVLQNFMSASDERGQPLHPHFDQVKVEMAAFLRSDPNLDLKGAYERAVWANPNLRNELLSAEKQSALEAERRAAAEKLQKAKIAGTHLRSQPTSGQPQSGRRSFKEAFDSAWDELSAEA